MEEVINSIYNGMRVQALEQLYTAGFNFEDLIIELIECSEYKEIKVMYVIALHNDYITEKGA